MKPTCMATAIPLAAWLSAAVVLSSLAGLLLATAGGWLYAPLYNVAAPFACDGELAVESRGHSPRVDSYRAKLNILCKDRLTGARTDITPYALFLAFLIYSGLTFAALAALTPAIIILARRLKPARALDALLPDPALPRPGATSLTGAEPAAGRPVQSRHRLG